MTTIKGISAGLIQGYENFFSKTELTTQNMFQMLSIELGGDGETINKEDLDSFIDDAKDGTIDISDQELNALTTLQQNWDTIAGEDNDSITFSNMKDYSTILVAAISGGMSSSNTNDDLESSSTDFTNDFYSYLEDATINNENDANSGLELISKSLLFDSTDENNDKNSNLTDTLTNLIAAYSSISTMETEA